jgi:HAD superfamily hydrolase (TIGR01549 family)
MYRGIIFDLDGTLIDSPLCFKTIRKALDIPDGHYILEHLAELPRDERNEKLQKLEAFEIEAAHHATLIPGVLETLNTAKSKNIRTGLLTRNCSAVVSLVLAKFDMCFDMTITRDEAPPKPNPAGLLRFISHWQIDKTLLLFVGDFRFDIDCGKACGIKTALFTNGQAADQSLQPDHLIHSYHNFWTSIQPNN